MAPTESAAVAQACGAAEQADLQPPAPPSDMFKGVPRVDSHPEFPDDVFKGAEPHHGPADDLPSDVFAGAEPHHGPADALPSDVFQGVAAIDRHPSIPSDVFAGPSGDQPGILIDALGRAVHRVQDALGALLHPGQGQGQGRQQQQTHDCKEEAKAHSD
ncbi:hypothetical protein HYH03_002564 [Edaphochlamys debaryana]|uniref:Uncharacterized protein n=1 Tax=Edaphochlamys debaryana TaxID=47281 RepID=A0A835YJA0_9CHLO|nr:hypothetical protein HYH03_002564 [Edaphochlamys debaryana]|eukprot:KAG2499625.1 hypothetical protein HYH03_002564 [Edaphochlamys debaryana]